MKLNHRILKNCIIQNKLLLSKNLVVQNFGNLSLRLDNDHFTIKPSGMDINKIKPTDIPIIKISDQKIVGGIYNPSVDTPTHLKIYKCFKEINSIAHTHSKFATAWAQSCKSIPNLGTTHSDYWLKSIPNLNFLSKTKVKKKYEKETGKLITDYIKSNYHSPFDCPGVILSGHGAFTWGKEQNAAVIHAELLEYISELAYHSINIQIKKKIPKYIIEKHFFRKHGKNSYYGQNKKKS